MKLILASISLPAPGDVYGLVALLKKLGMLASDYAIPDGVAFIAFLAWMLIMYLLLKRFLGGK